MQYISELFEKISVVKLASVIILALICLVGVKVILFIFDKFVKHSKLDSLVYKILRVSVKSLLLFTVVIIVLASLGISVSSFIATLSVVGVAFSLAIQGFLSNVFGGIQIISNKPFQLGDYVEAGGQSGIVREVGLFYTKLDTTDNKLIQIPNSLIANANIINYSSAKRRRVDINVSASYDDEVEKVKEVLLKLLSDHPLVLKEEGKKPVVHVISYDDSYISYTARCWCESGDYWTVYFDIMDAVKPAFDKNNITISYPHMNVHMITK
jgi:small conductance mechanosensitive channel